MTSDTSNPCAHAPGPSYVLDASSSGTVKGGLQYMRSLYRHDRMFLNQGPLLKTEDHEGSIIKEFPLALFEAASTKKELVVKNLITAFEEIGIEQVKCLLFLIMKIYGASHVRDLVEPNNTLIDLQLHSAAEELGMASFTQDIFSNYFERVNNRVPMRYLRSSQVRRPPQVVKLNSSLATLRTLSVCASARSAPSRLPRKRWMNVLRLLLAFSSTSICIKLNFH
jgi:hypothetical protein